MEEADDILGSKKKRLEGGGRKAAFPDMEEELAAWMREWS